jgi:hypothetical protein
MPYESRGNRIRRTPLGVERHFLACISLNLDRMSFALLYRNLMAACQIWCEDRSGRRNARQDHIAEHDGKDAQAGILLARWHGSWVLER